MNICRLQDELQTRFVGRKNAFELSATSIERLLGQISPVELQYVEGDELPQGDVLMPVGFSLWQS